MTLGGSHGLVRSAALRMATGSVLRARARAGVVLHLVGLAFGVKDLSPRGMSPLRHLYPVKSLIDSDSCCRDGTRDFYTCGCPVAIESFEGESTGVCLPVAR